jgi:hypothetical protein
MRSLSNFGSPVSTLKLTGAPVGLLFNFNATSIRAGMKRLEHPDEYAKNHPRGS